MSIVVWILLFLAAEAIIYSIQLLFRKKQLKRWVLFILAPLKFIIGTILAFLVLGGPLFLRPVQPLIVALYVVLIPDAISDLISGIFNIRILNIRRTISTSLAIAFLIFGTINMGSIKAHNLTYSSNKLKNEYTFVFMSDVHVGSAQSLDKTLKTINEIKKLKPDFVVLGGDITDDYTKNEQMTAVYGAFKDFNKQGTQVFYIYGNHDRQKNAHYAHGKTYTVSELEETITSNNIKILQDEYFEFADDLVLLGREDMSEETRKENIENFNPNKNAYLITFDHQPFDKKSIKEVGADLQFSGHTHAGQFFPLNLFYELFVGDSYGEYYHDKTTVYVTPGLSGWRVPFRTEARSQYEIVTIKPSK